MSTSRLRDTLQILGRTEKTDLWRRESFPRPPRSHSEPLIDLISKSYSSVAVRVIFFSSIFLSTPHRSDLRGPCMWVCFLTTNKRPRNDHSVLEAAPPHQVKSVVGGFQRAETSCHLLSSLLGLGKVLRQAWEWRRWWWVCACVGSTWNKEDHQSSPSPPQSWRQRACPYSGWELSGARLSKHLYDV